MRNNHYYDSVNKKTDADLWNLITSNINGGRVSMFLGAHDHDYQRSKQMSVRRNSGDIGCPGPLEGKHAFNTTEYLTPNPGNFTDYSSNCISNSGPSWTTNGGVIEVIQGTFGRTLDNVNDATNQPNAAQAPYFVTWMGSNYSPSSNRGHGWVKYNFVGTSDITVSTNFCRDGETPTSNFASCVVTPVYSDTFTILAGCCGGSVASGTLITMEDGSKVPVQNLQVGDQVISIDPYTRQSYRSTITSIKVVTVDNILIFHTSTGPPLRVDINPRLRFNAIHDGQPGLWSAVLLHTGDSLYQYDYGWTSITSIDRIYDGQHTYYDLNLSPLHDFIADGYADCPCKENPSG